MLNETSGEQRVRSARLAGFTVAELVAVVAVLALCMVILLPAVGHAREGSRTVSCQTTLFGFGQAMQIYANDNQDGIPGINTSGLAVAAKKFLWGSNPSVLSPRGVPVQNWDWMTPLLQDDPNLPDGRVARFHYLLSEYRCPEQPFQASLYAASTGPDIADFHQYTWPACSYLMPAWFQWFGQQMAGQVVCYTNLPSGGVVPIYAHVPSASWDVCVDDYSPRLDRVGPAARKVFVADGTRYVDSTGVIDVDVSVLPSYFGGFGSYGAWWCASAEYGVRAGTRNWCNQMMARGSPGQGTNLLLSYRHSLTASDVPTAPAGGVTSGGTHWGGVDLGGGDLQPIANGSAQSNRGYMNTVFFDGHVERLNDRASREIDLWYPTGAIVRTPAEGMTCATSGMAIP